MATVPIQYPISDHNLIMISPRAWIIRWSYELWMRLQLTSYNLCCYHCYDLLPYSKTNRNCLKWEIWIACGNTCGKKSRALFWLQLPMKSRAAPGSQQLSHNFHKNWALFWLQLPVPNNSFTTFELSQKNGSREPGAQKVEVEPGSCGSQCQDTRYFLVFFYFLFWNLGAENWEPGLVAEPGARIQKIGAEPLAQLPKALAPHLCL